MAALLEHTLSQNWEGNTLVLSFEAGSLWVDMFSEKRQSLMERLSQALGEEARIEIREQSSVKKEAPIAKDDQGR